MDKEESKLLHVKLTEKIIGVYFDVYNEIGHGFLESVYSNAMYRVGLLLNLGSSRAQFRRLVLENTNKKIRVHLRESAVRGSSEKCA